MSDRGAGQPRRFFVSPSVLSARNVTLTGDLAHRLARVLRLRRGDEVVLAAGGPREYVVRLDGVSANAITGVVVSERPAPAEASVEVVLYQSLIRPNRFDIALEKGTELGVARFVPVINARSQLSEESTAGRSDRWRRVVVEAAEQCGRGRLPTIDSPAPFEEALRRAPGTKIVPWEAEKDQLLADYLRSIPRPRLVSVFIGPEGGYTDEEVALARAEGAVLVSLGQQVLRSETAAVIACGIVLHELDRRL